uniref:Uncharacterized protein n=1 Tax=Cannabis sativa TaxID=3483 RepID=A0A803PRD0_CANSA
MATNNSSNDTSWYPNSGATNYWTYQAQNHGISIDYGGSDQLYMGDGTGQSSGQSNAHVDTPSDPQPPVIHPEQHLPTHIPIIAEAPIVIGDQFPSGVNRPASGSTVVTPAVTTSTYPIHGCHQPHDQHNSHPMKTRSKSGIHKPKAILVTREPSSLQEALSQLVWNKAMSDEVLALGEPLEDVQLYRSIIGALQYLTITRPELSFSVNKVRQFMQKSLSTHWSAVKRILRYVGGTTDHGLHLQKPGTLDLMAYCDADWASDPDDRRSTTRFAIFLGSRIAWKSKRQQTISRSSTEAEYRSVASVTVELTWLQYLFSKLRIQLSQTPTIWCDNLSTI